MAVLLSLCLIAVACGSTGDAEVSIGTSSSSEEDGPQYGDSLEEWSRAIGAERDAAAASSGSLSGLAKTAEYEPLTWEDLIAPGFSGEDITARYRDQLANLEDGSPEADALYEEMLDQYDGAAVNTQLDGTKVQLAGFVAPLTYDHDIITEFLLVPYFGACIHVPPPPPHQTVLVTLDESSGLTIDDTWGAVWVAGTLTATPATTDLATASYTITDAISGVYEDF